MFHSVRCLLSVFSLSAPQATEAGPLCSAPLTPVYSCREWKRLICTWAPYASHIGNLRTQCICTHYKNLTTTHRCCFYGVVLKNFQLLLSWKCLTSLCLFFLLLSLRSYIPNFSISVYLNQLNNPHLTPPFQKCNMPFLEPVLGLSILGYYRKHGGATWRTSWKQSCSLSR